MARQLALAPLAHAALELAAAVGKMTAMDMKLAVEVYDPRNHYEEVRGKWVGGSSSEEGK